MPSKHQKNPHIESSGLEWKPWGGYGSRSMQPRIPYHYQGIDGDMQRLETLLRDGLKMVNFSAQIPATVLNLACGRADETGTLFRVLAPAAVGFYLGIDLRPGDIEEAKKRWISDSPGTEIEFQVGDASRTERMRELPLFDLVFIRHQNYWHDAPVWDRMLANGLKALKEDGTLVITSYFDREHELAVASLKARGAQTLLNFRHFKSRELNDAPNKSVDRHIALFRRGS